MANNETGTWEVEVKARVAYKEGAEYVCHELCRLAGTRGITIYTSGYRLLDGEEEK